MTIEDFLQILEDRDLVPQQIVTQVRAKVEKGDRRITPKSLLKYLVKKELVTKRQAKQLLETTLTVTPNAESSILGMVPIPKVPPQSKSDKPKSLTEPSDEEIPTISPAEDSSSKLVTDEGPTVGSGADLFGEKPASLVSESLSKIGVGGDATLTEAIQEGNETSFESADEPKKKKRSKKKGKQNEWDSNLLLLGGGGLILLVITGVIIFYLLTRENADAILAEASEYYEGGSYTQAIKQYDRFVENHKKHPEHSAAVVKLGLAKIWKASSGTSNYREALITSRGVLRDIEDEEDFGTAAQQELGSLLPEIAQGLANQAERTDESDKVQELVKLTNEALAFCANTRYIPKKFRNDVLINEIGETLARVERSREEKAALEKALADMQSAIESRDMAAAYQVHEQLIDEHPGLLDNEQLAAKILEISAAESAVVKFVAEPRSAVTEPRQSAVVAELALANRSGPTNVGNGTTAVRVSGAVYGFNLADGSLLWRQFVGIAPELSPVQLPNSELLVIDAQTNELLKLEARTGNLIWRHPFESAITRPVVFDDRILVAETAGKLHVLEANTGERKGYVQFAQPLSTSPAVGSQGKRIYIAGDHSSLYTLSSTDFACLGVFYLGHSKGSVRTPPVNVLNKVVVAVSKGLATSSLEALNTTADGIPEVRAVSRRVSGLVNTALLVDGRRLVAATSRGQVVAYEVGASTGESALTQIAEREAEGGTPVARFGLLHDGHVWVAGPKLSKLAVLPTSDRLSVSNIDNAFAGDIFDHPLQTAGDLLIHVRRPEGEAGAIVSAMNVNSGLSQWQTEIAATPAGAAAADPAGMQLGAVASSGTAFLVDREAMRSRVVNKAEKLSRSRKLSPLEHSLDLGEGRILASAVGSEVLVHFRPGLPRGALNAIKLVGPLSCPPTQWQDGFVVPTSAGQVFYFASEDGQQRGTPFQPPLEPGVTYDWLQPAVFGSGDSSQLVLSDGKKRVYLLEYVASPQPHLTSVENADISTAPLNTRIAVIGDIAVVGATDGSLSTFQLPTLAPGPSVKLDATVTWGPFVVDSNLVLATSSEELVCLDESGNIAWRKALQHGPPAGKPLAYNGGIELLSQTGGISRVDLASGEESSFTPLPQPVVAGPVPFGRRLVVSAYDGTLLVINHPE